MKKRLPPLNWLRSFEASARHLNFTQAAAELHMTQAAISQQIKGLEAQLGCALFKRLPRGLALTDSGNAYAPSVRQAIETLSVVTDEIFGKERSRTLTVRVNLAFFTSWLAPRLANFREQHPDIGLRFTSNLWVGDPDKDADIEIRYGKGLWPGFTSNRLTWDELFPVCSPDLVGGSLSPAQPPKKPKELSDHTLLHVIGYEEGWGIWLSQFGYHDVDSSQGISFDSLITAMEMAALGHGVALGRTSLVAGMLASGRLIAPFNERLATSEAFFLATPVNQHIHPHVEAFRYWLINQAELEMPE